MKNSGEEMVRQNGPVGLWGWNTIPFLNLVAAAGLEIHTVATSCCILILRLWSSEGEPLAMSLVALIIFEIMMNLGLAVLAVTAVGAMFKRRKAYAALAKWAFWLSVAVVLADNCLGVCAGASFSAEDVKTIVHGFVFALIWTAYYNKSVRIRNTFTAPWAGNGIWLRSLLIVLGLTVLWTVSKMFA